MTTTHRRIALLAGASVSAFALASPALADHITPGPGVYPGPDAPAGRVIVGANAVNTLVVCDLLDANTDPDVCFAGVVATGTGVVNAFVVDVSTGEVRQVGTATGAPPAGGNVDLDIINGPEAHTTIGAIATATAAAGVANANAYVDTGIYQEGDGAGNILLDIANAGSLTIRARATATAADADATADIDQAIVQDGNSTGAAGVVTVTLTNTNDLNVDAAATANGTNTADATSTMGALAFGGGAIHQTAIGAGTGAVTARIANTGDMDLTSTSNASVTAGTGIGNSIATIGLGISQTADSNGGGAALAEITTSGAQAIDIAATANAVGNVNDDAADLEADAFANGIIQLVESGGGTGGATARVTNNNAINIDALANAFDADVADATAGSVLGIYQAVNAAGTGTAATATAIYEGTGDLTVDVVAVARGDNSNSVATQTLGVLQSVTAVNGAALASLDTTATSFLDFNVSATSRGTVDADAVSDVFAGIDQIATSTNAAATTDLDIDGGLSMDNFAVANLVPGSLAPIGGVTATANTDFGVLQTATAGTDRTALARITNDSASVIIADATANGAGFVTTLADFYAADASATIGAAFAQTAFAADDATTTATVGAGNTDFISTGAVTVLADADAVAVAGTAAAADANSRADALAVGVTQSANGTANFSSAAAFNVTADATASGVELAEADALAIGIEQELVGTAGTARFRSTAGSIGVTANARATATGTGGVGDAVADAVGYSVMGQIGVLDVDNDRSFLVLSNATGTTTAEATGLGWLFEAMNTQATPTRQALLSGIVRNDGTLSVVSTATGAAGTAAGGTATATGILFDSGVNTVTLTNTGSILIDAIADAGGAAEANGIVVLNNGTGTAPTAGQVMTINNSGTIRVRESVNGGTTFRRGMAIDVADAPNPVVINLLGGGNIFGDIDIGADDVINVDNGETALNGTVNPECVALIGTDLAARAACTQGVLNITNDGILTLLDNNAETPTRIFVDTFTIADGGVVAFQLDGETGGTVAAGTYPQIFADTANLNGTLQARLQFDGLFEDNLFFNNLIDANVRNGTFDACRVAGFEGSLLINVTCIYDAGANVDLGIERVPFNEVAGLNRNGIAVGEGLECIYDPDMTGGMANLLRDLFLFNDPVQFNAALNQLAGAGYANYLQSFTSLGVRYNDILDHATSCEVPALAGSVLECRAAPVHVWGQIDFQNRKTDGDDEVVGYDADRWTALVGADFSVGGAAIVGASVGRVTNRVDSNAAGGTFKADGYQVGAYGVFDPGAFYVKALGTYSWFDGDSDRLVNFQNFGGGATTAGVLGGDPDVRMWTLGLHGGARIPMGPAAVITPYANLDHTNARMDGFVETGLDGANLTVFDARQKRTTLTAGVKFAGDMGGVVPELNLGYRHQFGDRNAGFRAAFLGDEDCDFTILSEEERRGAILAGLSVGGKAGPVDVRVGYQGLFNKSMNSHAGNFRIILPFGGAPAPVAAPAYVAPPPPPAPEPAPMIEQAPPPPPPPAPSGERGE